MLLSTPSSSSSSRSQREKPLWLFDAGPDVGFQPYSDDLSKQVGACLSEKRGLFAFSVNQRRYELDLDSMVQRNVQTGKQRAVVRLLLKSTHAVLDRDSARVFTHLSYGEVVAWIKEHAPQPVQIDRALDKGPLMTVATKIFHASAEFPVLQRRDGSPFDIRTKKTGKVIRGGAKPLRLDVGVTPVAAVAPRVGSRDWAVELIGDDNLASRIVKVEYLSKQCAPLMELFRAFKKTMPAGTTVATVFHGTLSATAQKIAKSGFDYRFNDRAAYGKGNYFAVNAQYAFSIAPKNPYGEKTVIVALIVHHKVIKGVSGMTLPPDGYDTTVDDENRPTIFVTYKVM